MIFNTLKFLNLIFFCIKFNSFVDWKTKEQGTSEMIPKNQEQGGIGLSFWLFKTGLDFFALVFPTLTE